MTSVYLHNTGILAKEKETFSLTVLIFLFFSQILTRGTSPILPQSVSSLGENADKELSRLVRSICGRHNDVVTRVQVQLPPHTPEGQNQ